MRGGAVRALGIFSGKGGVGKSTLAIHLSTLMQDEGRTLLVDSDPQASLAYWSGRRTNDRFGVAGKSLAALGPVLRAAGETGVKYVLVDTPPSLAEPIPGAIKSFDFILVPLRPSALDIAAVARTIAMVKTAGTAFGCVLNMCPPSRNSRAPAVVREVHDILTGLGAPVFEATLTHRVAFQNAINSGETVGEFDPSGAASAEISALWAEIKMRLNEAGRG